MSKPKQATKPAPKSDKKKVETKGGRRRHES